MSAWPAQSDQLLIKPKLLLKKIVDFSLVGQTNASQFLYQPIVSDNKFDPQNLISQRNSFIFAPEQSLASKHQK